MADETTRGVHLNEKQLVFVLMAGVVICGVMFLFGVLVGRGVQATRGSAAEGTMVSAPQVVPDPAPPADAAGANPGGSQLDELSYTKRLQQPDSPVVPLANPPGGPPSGTAPPAGAAVSRDVSQPPPDAPDESAAASSAGSADARPYTIQVAAFPKRGDAEAEVKRLKAKGYDARVVAPEAGDKIRAFRVRVGSYKTRREADVVARRLATGGQYTPWVIH